MQIRFSFSQAVGLVGVVMAAVTLLSGSAGAASENASIEGIGFGPAPTEDAMSSQTSLRALESATVCRPLVFSNPRSSRTKRGAEPVIGSFSAPCVAISDGDTLVVKREGTLVTIDLNAIDAPELTQNFGIEAKLALSRVVLGRTLRIYPTKRDASGKIHAWVLKGTTEVNRHQVQSGFAWWSSSQAPTEIEISQLQEKARAARLGLWSSDAPTSPWAWRKRQEAQRRSLAI